MVATSRSQAPSIEQLRLESRLLISNTVATASRLSGPPDSVSDVVQSIQRLGGQLLACLDKIEQGLDPEEYDEALRKLVGRLESVPAPILQETTGLTLMQRAHAAADSIVPTLCVLLSDIPIRSAKSHHSDLMQIASILHTAGMFHGQGMRGVVDSVNDLACAFSHEFQKNNGHYRNLPITVDWLKEIGFIYGEMDGDFRISFANSLNDHAQLLLVLHAETTYTDPVQYRARLEGPSATIVLSGCDHQTRGELCDLMRALGCEIAPDDQVDAIRNPDTGTAVRSFATCYGYDLRRLQSMLGHGATLHEVSATLRGLPVRLKLWDKMDQIVRQHNWGSDETKAPKSPPDDSTSSQSDVNVPGAD